MRGLLMAKEKASGLYLCTVGFGAAGNGDDYNSTRRQCEPSYLRCQRRRLAALSRAPVHTGQCCILPTQMTCLEIQSYRHIC